MKAILYNVTLMNQSICVPLSYFCYFQSLAWVIWLWRFSVLYTVDLGSWYCSHYRNTSTILRVYLTRRNL